MNELFNFHKFDPFTVGFDKMFKDLQDSMEKIPTYPPYNIKQVKDNKYVIEMAVAGFGKADVEVTLDGNKLVVSGTTAESEDEVHEYFHKGIANRNFKHTFKLADKVEIENAEMVNGMLKIWLSNLVKTQDAIKKIAIK
jgi:molecular chaperone IbpA